MLQHPLTILKFQYQRFKEQTFDEHVECTQLAEIRGKRWGNNNNMVEIKD
jgi:hypothetical protein